MHINPDSLIVVRVSTWQAHGRWDIEKAVHVHYNWLFSTNGDSMQLSNDHCHKSSYWINPQS